MPLTPLRSASLLLSAALCVGAFADGPDSPNLAELFPIKASGLGADFEQLPKTFTQILADALTEAGSVTREADSVLSDTALAFGCDAKQLGCLEQLTSLLEVNELVWGRMTSSPKGVQVELRRFIATTGLKRASFEIPKGSLLKMSAVLDAKLREELGLKSKPAPDPDPDPETDLADQADKSDKAELAVTPSPGAVVDPTEPAADFDFARVKGWSYGVAGAGVVALVAGGALFSTAAGVRQEVEKAPTGTLPEIQALQALETKGLGYTRGGSALLIGGGVLVAGSALLMVLQASDAPEGSASSLGVQASLQLTPLISTKSAGLLLTLALP